MRERLGAWWRQVVLAGFVGGLAVGPFALLAAAGVALLRRPGLALGVVVAVVAGTAVGDARVAALHRTTLGEELGQGVSERAILLERPRARAFQVGAAARIRGERVVLQGGPALWPRGLEIGMEVAVQGRLEALAGWQDFERRRGAHAALEATAIRATGRRRGGPAGFVDGVRSRAERALTLGMPAQQAALARGMVLGQDDALDERTLEAFRVSGLAHLLTV